MKAVYLPNISTELEIMFDDFLENMNTYIALEQFWIQLCYSELNKQGISSDDWIIPFYNTYFNNQEKEMDGNPIFSAKSKRAGKIIKIIQTHDDSNIVDTWNDKFDGNEEFVIFLTWSSENIEKTKFFISNWLNKIVC